MYHIFIYPSKNKILNVNETQFITVPELINRNDCICVDDLSVGKLYDLYSKYENNIKSIIILLDNYGKFIYSNLDFIKSHPEINFYIHENDIHKLESKPDAFMRYFALRSILQSLNNVYILAYYWYHYSSLYSIQKDNLICFPRFIKEINATDMNMDIIPRVLLSGSISRNYPMRSYLANLGNPNVDILKRNAGIYGKDYLTYLKKYVCCFTCCSNSSTPYIINKFFEIPFTGSLLLAYDEFVKKPLKSLGFIDQENYISCDRENIKQKISWICDIQNREEVNRIRKNGYELVRQKHTDKIRFQDLLNLIDTK
jgi:hypothetical protein